jgi:hypothetical protein
MFRAHAAVGWVRRVWIVGRVDRLLSGKDAGGVQSRKECRVFAPPLGRGSGAASTGIQQSGPGNGLGQGG